MANTFRYITRLLDVLCSNKLNDQRIVLKDVTMLV